MKKKRNPQLMIITNPARRELIKAAAAYKRFHGVNPRRGVRLGKGSRVLISLGELKEVVYKPRRGERAVTWFHRFGRGVQLATDVDGKDLYIIHGRKGRTRVDFARGIVG